MAREIKFKSSFTQDRNANRHVRLNSPEPEKELEQEDGNSPRLNSIDQCRDRVLRVSCGSHSSLIAITRSVNLADIDGADDDDESIEDLPSQEGRRWGREWRETTVASNFLLSHSFLVVLEEKKTREVSR